MMTRSGSASSSPGIGAPSAVGNQDCVGGQELESGLGAAIANAATDGEAERREASDQRGAERGDDQQGDRRRVDRRRSWWRRGSRTRREHRREDPVHRRQPLGREADQHGALLVLGGGTRRQPEAREAERAHRATVAADDEAGEDQLVAATAVPRRSHGPLGEQRLDRHRLRAEAQDDDRTGARGAGRPRRPSWPAAGRGAGGGTPAGA